MLPILERLLMAQSGSSQDELDSLVYYRFLLTTAVRILTQRAEPPEIPTTASTSLRS